MPPSALAADAIAGPMPLMPASKTVTPPPSSSIRYTFIARGTPPRTRQTPSATGSAALPDSLRAALVFALKARRTAVSEPVPGSGSIPIWRAKPSPSGNATLAVITPSLTVNRSRPRSSTRPPVGRIPW